MNLTSIAYVMVPHGSGISTSTPAQMAPLAAANVNGGEQGLLLVATMVASGDGGNPVSIVGLTDNADNVTPLSGVNTNLFQGAVSRLTLFDGTNWDRARSLVDNADAQAVGTIGLQGGVSRLQGYNDAGNVWQRIRVQNDSGDGLATGIGHLSSMAHLLAFNGATWDRVRTNSASVLAGTTQPFGGLVAEPGEWAVNSEPAVNTLATATRAAGAAGVRHVCRSLHFSLNAVAAQTNIYCRVRDGASGAGTILWSQAVALPAGGLYSIALSGLNIVGSPATAMTFEWSAASAGGNFETAGGTGYSTI